ncbi:hypothetical protein CEXT_221601 [Caerostris extrusa]|uniref:Uncharacterized protein n=1 Tax=Caerostris extrusa TaxID=172846 RepID=A0AAV4QD31_CAEEX|nr:hypothetical protein CEXT_221601 [Caerostris extrusa]
MICYIATLTCINCGEPGHMASGKGSSKFLKPLTTKIQRNLIPFSVRFHSRPAVAKLSFLLPLKTILQSQQLAPRIESQQVLREDIEFLQTDTLCTQGFYTNFQFP